MVFIHPRLPCAVMNWVKFFDVNKRQKALRKDFQNVDPLLPGNIEVSVIKGIKQNQPLSRLNSAVSWQCRWAFVCFIIECVVREKEEEVTLVCVSHTHIIHVDICGLPFALVLAHHWNPKDYLKDTHLAFVYLSTTELQKCSSGFSHFKLLVVHGWVVFPPAFFHGLKGLRCKKRDGEMDGEAEEGRERPEEKRGETTT